MGTDDHDDEDRSLKRSAMLSVKAAQSFARLRKKPVRLSTSTDDGTIRIASVDGASGKEAHRERIELITADVEVGRIYDGKVARLMDFGAFVTILPGKDGLVHISQISNERVEKVSDKLARKAMRSRSKSLKSIARAGCACR